MPTTPARESGQAKAERALPGSVVEAAERRPAGNGLRHSVVVIEQQTITRELLKEFIARLDGFEAVGAAGAPTLAEELCVQLRPSVVLLDAAVADPQRPSLALSLRQRVPGLKILILGTVEIETLRDALNARVSGFVDRGATLEMLQRALNAVAAGRQFFSPKATELLRDLVRTRGSRTEGVNLTPRERMVLRGIATGRSSKEVASEFGLSVFTVENIRRRLMKKTGLRSVAELTLHALRLGLISPPGVAASQRLDAPVAPGASATGGVPAR